VAKSNSNDLASSLTALIGANDESATVKQWLDTGYPPFNHALSSKWDGGFPVGRIIELSGPASSGKTAIATKAMIAAQKMGGIAAFMDHEHSYDQSLAEKLGLDASPGRFVYKKPRTYEDSLTLAVTIGKHVRDKKLIKPDAPICIVFDSLASMVPQSALYEMKNGKRTGAEKGLDDRNMHDNTALARATSGSMPAFSLYCEELGICAIFLNQIRMKLGVMYGDPRTTPGGEAPKFYASQRIMLGGAKKVQKGKGEDAEVLGVSISAGVIKNKCSRPFTKADWRFMYQPDGSGRFDVERSMVEFLEGEGAIATGSKAGYVVWDGKQVYKEHLARDIQDRNALSELIALLPAEYAAPIMTEIPIEGAEEADPVEDAA
jgi:recombination protein RecA